MVLIAQPRPQQPQQPPQQPQQPQQLQQLQQLQQQKADQLTIVQVPWSPEGAKAHTFSIARRDIFSLSLSEIARQPFNLTAATRGRRRELVLLDELTAAHQSLNKQLAAQLNTRFHQGLTVGSQENRKRDAGELTGLKLLEAKNLQHLWLPADLPPFSLSKVQWPRSREVYRAPLLLVKELAGGPTPGTMTPSPLAGKPHASSALAAATMPPITDGPPELTAPRILAAVATQGLVFQNSCFGAPIPTNQPEVAHLLAAVLSSSLASWFYSLTAAEFTPQKKKLSKPDLEALPVPELIASAKSATGKRLLAISRKLRRRKAGTAVSPADWAALDDAVCDLYQLNAAERVIIRDGLTRASWQASWQRLKQSAEPANYAAVANYARVFLAQIAVWLAARNKRTMRAEIIDLPPTSPLRVVRFVLQNKPGNSGINRINPAGELNEVLTELSDRLQVPIASELVAERELRVHGPNEVVIIKPAANRYWLGIAAIEDADSVIVESFTRARA